HVSLADAPLDGDATDVALAHDLRQALFLHELGELRDGDPLAARRADSEGLQGFEIVPLVRQLDGEREAALTLEDLGDGPAFGRRLDRVLDVLYEDAVARRRLPVHDDLELRLADEMVVVEIDDTADARQH